MMHYVCIENNQVTSVLNYRPNVPNSIKVVEITDEQNVQCSNGTHYFDTNQNKVVPQSQSVLNAQEIDKQNAVKRNKLQSTDWIVLRHIREKALGVPTSITEAEYVKIEQERQEIAKTIVNL